MPCDDFARGDRYFCRCSNLSGRPLLFLHGNGLGGYKSLRIAWRYWFVSSAVSASPRPVRAPHGGESQMSSVSFATWMASCKWACSTSQHLSKEAEPQAPSLNRTNSSNTSLSDRCGTVLWKRHIVCYEGCLPLSCRYVCIRWVEIELKRPRKVAPRCWGRLSDERGVSPAGTLRMRPVLGSPGVSTPRSAASRQIFWKEKSSEPQHQGPHLSYPIRLPSSALQLSCRQGPFHSLLNSTNGIPLLLTTTRLLGTPLSAHVSQVGSAFSQSESENRKPPPQGAGAR